MNTPLKFSLALWALCIAFCATYATMVVRAQAPIANIAPNTALATPVSNANGGTGTGTAFTQNAIVFAGAAGVYSQAPSFFNYDATAKTLTVSRDSSGDTVDLKSTFTGTWMKLTSDNTSGNAIIQIRNTADSAFLGLNLQPLGGDVLTPGIKSTTGVRFVCVDTNGKLVSQAAACSGT